MTQRLHIACLQVALAVASLGAQQPDTTGTLWIDVREAATGRPVGGARVEIPGTRRRVTTDSAGMATIPVDSAHSLLVISRLGFRPDTSVLTTAVRSAGVLAVRLIASTQVLEPVGVTATSPTMNAMMTEFEGRRRRAAGGASFIGPEQFEKSGLPRLTDFLRRGVQGVTLIDSAGILLPVSSRGSVLRTNQGPALGRNPITRRSSGDALERVHCVLRIAVDGVPKEWGFDLRQIDPREVYGMEIYAGPATIPAQYQSMGRDGFCGLILVWTRPR